MKSLYTEGWLFIPKENYHLGDSITACTVFREMYSKLPLDPYGPGRARSHIKMRLDVESGELTVAGEQSYSQTREANDYDGGKVRVFARVSEEMLDSSLFQSIVTANLTAMLKLFKVAKPIVTIGIHCVRYLAKAGDPGEFASACYSSPIWLHKDDEPIVFLNVLNESPNLVGGDSLIACEKNHINHAFHLSPLDGVLLTKNCWHAVTPMAAPTDGRDGFRDILLVTLEEDDSVIAMKESIEGVVHDVASAAA
jgi:hypothetical protein